MIAEFLEMTRWLQRRRTLCKQVEDTVENEGGMVEEVTIIGMLLKSPFPPVNIKPVYLKVSCRYANDRGAWYICGTVNTVYWVWASDTGAMVPPTNRTHHVSVDNGVVALPRWVSILLYAVLITACVSIPFVFLALT